MLMKDSTQTNKSVRHRATIRFDDVTYQLINQFAQDNRISMNAAVLALVRAGANSHELAIAPIVADAVRQTTTNTLTRYLNRVTKLLSVVALQAGTARHLSQAACLQHTAMLLADHEPDDLLQHLQLYDTPAGRTAMDIHDTFVMQAEQLALADLKRPLQDYLDFFQNDSTV